LTLRTVSGISHQDIIPGIGESKSVGWYTFSLLKKENAKMCHRAINEIYSTKKAVVRETSPFHAIQVMSYVPDTF